MRSYPHPVLRSDSNDYEGMHFSAKISAGITDEEMIKLDIIWSLTDRAIRAKLFSQEFSLTLMVKCSNTFFLHYYKFKSKDLDQAISELLIPSKLLYGDVELKPMIFVSEDVESFFSEDFNPEFKSSTFDLKRGSFVAVGQSQIITPLRKKIDFKNYVLAKESDDVPKYQYEISVDASSAHIEIIMGKNLYEVFSTKYKLDEDTEYFFMSIYKDCFYSALECIVENPDIEHEWAKALIERLGAFGKDLPREASFNKLNSLAQILIEDVGPKKIKLREDSIES